MPSTGGTNLSIRPSGLGRVSLQIPRVVLGGLWEGAMLALNELPV